MSAFAAVRLPEAPTSRLRPAVAADDGVTGSVARHRLLHWLDQGVPVAILHGPAGSGKSELVEQWMRSRTGHESVLTTTAAAIVDGRFSTLLQTVPSVDNGNGVVVVIDEVDEDLPVNVEQTMFATIKQRPDVRYVVSGRRTSGLEERAQRARMKTTVRSGDSLLATVPEAIAFATAWGSSLDAERIAEVVRLTGGWLEPTRLVLCNSTGDSLDLEAALRWVTSVVLDDMSPRELTVLDRLSLLPSINSDTLAFAFTDHGAHDVFTSLRDRGLLRRGVDGAWAITSPLVRRALDERVRALAPAEVEKLHVEIAESACARDPRMCAGAVLHHARLGKAWGLLKRFWVEHGSTAMAEHPHQARAAFAAIPENVVSHSTTLAVAAAVATSDSSGQGILERLEHYSCLHRSGMDSAQLEGTTGEFVEAAVIRMTQLRRAGRFAQAHELGERVDFEVNRREDAGENRATAVHAALLLIQRAVNHMLSGDQRASAAALTRQALVYAQASRLGSLVSGVSDNLAVLLAASGRLEPSGISATAVDAGPVVSDVVRSGLGSELATAMTAIDALDRQRAHAALSRTGSRAIEPEIWPFVTLARSRYVLFFESQPAMDTYYRNLVWSHPTARGDASTGCLALEALAVLADLRAGRLEQAERRIGRSADHSEWMSVLTARLHLSKLDHDAALRAATAGNVSDTLGNRERAQLLFIGAAGSMLLGQSQQAAALFRQARSLADGHGLLSTYLVISHDQRTRLLALTGEALPPATAGLLSSFPDIYPEDPPRVTLSARETEVLGGIAIGNSHREIAGSLYISVATVRTYVRTLYAKLAVSDRVAAIGRARELGLLPEY